MRIVTLALWPCVEAGLRVGLGGGVRCACVKVKHLWKQPCRCTGGGWGGGSEQRGKPSEFVLCR